MQSVGTPEPEFHTGVQEDQQKLVIPGQLPCNLSCLTYSLVDYELLLSESPEGCEGF